MKYTINGFYQPKLIELGLDCVDAVILESIVDISIAKKTVRSMFEDGWYFWLNYKEMVNELPIINLGLEAFKGRIKKYVKIGLLSRKVERNSKGSFSMLAFNNNIYSSLKYDSSNHQ